MPFTPFHFGPGATVKGLSPRYFSFSVFCFAQVIMDLEVPFLMARNADRWHGWSHTLVGATVMGMVSLAIGWPVCRRLLRWWSAQPDVPLKEYYNPIPEILAVPAITGAFVGTFSHLFIDAIMHSDVRPLWPFSDSNGLFGLIGAGTMHGICFVLGVIGALICARVRSPNL